MIEGAGHRPACAGNTTGKMGMAHRPERRARSVGDGSGSGHEAAERCATSCARTTGSAPRARGTQVRRLDAEALQPRVSHDDGVMSVDAGSAPRARGTRRRAVMLDMTPEHQAARAGRIAVLHHRVQHQPAAGQPRVRGEHGTNRLTTFSAAGSLALEHPPRRLTTTRAADSVSAAVGSAPRARGTPAHRARFGHLQGAPLHAVIRVSPACAGNTPSRSSLSLQNVRMGHRACQLPPARPSVRVSPACAGNTPREAPRRKPSPA